MNQRRKVLLIKAIERSNENKQRRIVKGEVPTETQTPSHRANRGVVPTRQQFPQRQSSKPVGMVWECGITTVPERKDDLLPRTIDSLNRAGFVNPISPRLFVDGSADPLGYKKQFNLPVTVRDKARTFVNWYLGMLELYMRNPHADRYVMFQDDIVLSADTREYLEHCTYPDKGYLNLITYPQNEALKSQHYPGQSKDHINGWYPSNQLGKGAQGLVFDHQTLVLLLSSRYMIERPQDERRGWRGIDGGIVSAMKRLGITEYVHTPSLIRHTGVDSTMGNNPQPLDQSFQGEGWSAMELIRRDGAR